MRKDCRPIRRAASSAVTGRAEDEDQVCVPMVKPATSKQVSDTVDSSDSRLPYGFVAVVLVVVVLFGSIRFRLRNIPLERDEGEYAYAGQLILQGVPPYQLAYSMKLPGTYAAYAGILAVFGETPAGVHLGLIFLNAATTLVMYMLAAYLFGRMAGVVAAANYALLSTSSSVLGLAGHATHFVVLPALAGLLLLLKALKAKRISLFFYSGLLLGLAVLMKQPGIFFVAFAGVYVLYRECRRGSLNWRNVVKTVGTYSIGAILPLAVTCVVLAASGVFARFWFWTWSYAHEYASVLSIAEGANMFRETFPQVIGPVLLVWVLAGAGLTALLWDRAARTHAPFVIGFLLFSAAAVCPGLYFRPHYFILLMPAVAVLTGLAVSSATRKLHAISHSAIVTALPMVVFVLLFGYTIFQQRAIFFEADPLAACRMIYGGNPFPEALQVADYIRTHTSNEERIAVLGSEPEIYFYSGRRSATGYIYTYGLMEQQKYALKMQREMVEQIGSERPSYVVAVLVPTSWLRQPGSETLIFSWTDEYLQREYEVVGIVDIQEQSNYVWGAAATNYSPQSPFVLYVFKRKGP